ncbi:hypothetical protein AgCh_028842 [Apium graveolens]
MDPDNEMSMYPGSRDSSVLHLQSTHRSDLIWKAGGGDSHRSRKRDPNQSRFPRLYERMLPILSDLSFDGVTRLSSIDLDWGLLSALVERWRPETHTFHLPVGECSITLQEVNVLLGLKIDGDVVIGLTVVNGGYGPGLDFLPWLLFLVVHHWTIQYEDIPPNDSYSKELHKIKLQGKQDSNWTFVHRDHVSHWVDRVLHVVTGITGSGVIDGYAELYSRITRLFHRRLVSRGLIAGDMSYIESIANNGVNLLQEQFNHGVFQDFPLEARREKEIEIQKKPKRVGHKGGRGGVDAPRDEGEILGDTSTQVHENEVDERGETILSHLHEEMTDNVPQFNLGISQTPPPYPITTSTCYESASSSAIKALVSATVSA